MIVLLLALGSLGAVVWTIAIGVVIRAIRQLAKIYEESKRGK